MKRWPLLICFLLIHGSCSRAAPGPSCADSSDMVQTRQCAAQDRDLAEQTLKLEVQAIAVELVEFAGEESSEAFLKLQEEWKLFVQAQCRHQRTLYGRGSMGSLSEITCRDHMARQRSKALSVLYKEAMSPP